MVRLQKRLNLQMSSRALGGALDSNLAVIRSIIAELTDHTNLALAYSYQPIVSSIGTVLG